MAALRRGFLATAFRAPYPLSRALTDSAVTYV